MDLALNVNASSSDLLVTAKQAATEIFSDSNTAFEEIKNRPWYKSLLNIVTFQRGDKKMVVRNVRNLASLQSIYMEIYTKQLKSQDAELDSLMEQILSTQQFAYKMYISCVLRLKPQTDIEELSESDQQVLLLLLGEFNRSDCLDAKENEKLQQYNRGVFSSLCVSRPLSELNPEQLEKVQFPDVFYRCVLEQCAVTGRLDPLQMPDNVANAIQWLDISEKKRERILTLVNTETNEYGVPFFSEKYKKPMSILSEDNLDLVDDISETFGNEGLAEEQALDSEANVSGKDESNRPFYQLISMIQKYTMTKNLGKPLLITLAEPDKNKLIARILPTILPVSKTVAKITKLKNGHLVFTTSAMYWSTNKDIKKSSILNFSPAI